MANATSSAAAEVSSSSDCVVVNGTFRPSMPTSQSIRVTLRRSFTRRNARERVRAIVDAALPHASLRAVCDQTTRRSLRVRCRYWNVPQPAVHS